MENFYTYREIEDTLVKITPIDLGLAQLETSDANLIQGCKEFHKFIVRLLKHMYEQPETYFVHPGEYEARMKEKFIKLEPRWHNASTNLELETMEDINSNVDYKKRKTILSYEVKIRNKTNYNIHFFQKFLFYISQYAEFIGNTLSVNISGFDAACERIGGKGYAGDSSPWDRVQCLAHVGLNIVRMDDRIVIQYPQSPLMFPVMVRLSKEAYKNKKYGYFNFKYCNFGQLNRVFKPAYPEIVQCLPICQRQIADDLNQYAAENKLRGVPFLEWKISYQYKSQVVFRFCSETRDYVVTVMCCIDCTKANKYDLLMQKEPQDVQRFLIDNLNYCIDCGNCRNAPGLNGREITLLGKTYRVCGWYMGFTLKNPTEQQVEYIKKFIQIRKEYIVSLDKA